MSEKIVNITYFSLNYISIILALILLNFLIMGILYLWLYFIQLKHNNYCSPLMMFLFGEKACNKMIYKTVDDEFKAKLDPVYVDIKNNMEELNTQQEINNVIKTKMVKNAVDNNIEKQTFLIENANVVNSIKDNLRNINNSLIQNIQSARNIYSVFSTITQNIKNQLSNVLDYIQYQINVSYVTPGLSKLINPLLKLYSAIATMANTNTKPNLKTNTNSDFSAPLEKSTTLFRLNLQ